MRFLIARLSSLGDVVCTLPVAVALRNRYPESEIVWAVSPASADVVRACSAVNRVLEVKPNLHPSTWPVIDGEFDAAFDMQGLLKSAIVVKRTKARRKLGYHWQREGSAFFSAAVTPDPSSLHVVDQYVDVARAYDAETDRAQFGLAPSPGSIAEVDALLKSEGIEGRFVALNAGAGWASKRWPPSAFAEVIKGLQEQGVTAVLIGGKDDSAKEAGDAVFHYCRAIGAAPPATMIGRTSIAQLIALIGAAQAHLGGDTGSTHIAAALGIPAIGLYSITRPERVCPYGQRERTHYDPEGLDRTHPKAVLNTVLQAIQA